MNSFWKLIDEKDILAPFDFCKGLDVYIRRPHIVNQKILACEILEDYSELVLDKKLLESLKEDFDVKEIKGMLSNGGAFSTVQESSIYSENYVLQEKTVNGGSKAATTLNENRLIFRNLIPRQLNRFQDVLEIVVLDHKTSASFYAKKSDVLKSRVTPAFPYKFTYDEESSRIKLEVLQSSHEETRYAESVEWLKSKVFPKIIKWCQDIPKSPIIPSIRLLSAKDYNVNLHYLKSKYAEKFIKIWPEYNNTDPEKYVYEDIAIAAYLITLWNCERETLKLSRKQTFIDLGCGNGLLDHILSSEGHVGLGIDLRKRKIWSVYGPGTNLIERVIEPNDNQFYPGYDWIIGNHPDELTPWIPVIASRSSYDMRVFLLPCCFYTFDGKYERLHHQDTQYQSYLKFLTSLCVSMGFHTEVDKLRIPSTKRTCIICPRRNYRMERELDIETQRKEFIINHSKMSIDSPNNENYFAISTWTGNESCEEKPSTGWVPNFIPRECVEKVQNCSQLDREITDTIIRKIVNHLLATDSIVALECGDKIVHWNQGGSLGMKELCNFLGPELLKCMKAQNGGIQTFLRNHSFIFEVKDNVIKLRLPHRVNASDIESVAVLGKKKKRIVKKRPNGFRKRNCFFYFNHPQGCPLSSNECMFFHEDLER